MYHTNPTQGNVARTRFMGLVLAVSMLAASGAAASCQVSAASAQIVNKVHQLAVELKAAVRYSIRLYRFYKLVSEKPVTAACAGR
jgi:uncharacterized BrkB/YihY/UPF0761 family membrane protein